MGTKLDIAINIVAEKETGERKALLTSEEFGFTMAFNLEELRSLHKGITAAIDYIEKHGTYRIESVPEGAVRH